METNVFLLMPNNCFHEAKILWNGFFHGIYLALVTFLITICVDAVNSAL